MRKSLLTLMCLAAMMAAGMSLRAQEVTITLLPGWTWISYPRADTLDIATALGTFTPMEGDIIKTQYGFSNYHEGNWNGSVQYFYPGMGYMYYSTRIIPTIIVFGVSTPQAPVVVTTSEPTDITQNSATCGGNVASSSGDYVFVILRGICWGTNPNPTFNDNYIEAGNGLGSFTVSMTELDAGTIYYVRAFAVTPIGTFYGDEESFIPDYAYVDLGLPSGLLWAICNVGAETPEGYGNYYAWGETQPKNIYNWNTYQYCNGSSNTLTKYCGNSNYGHNGFTDNLTNLLPEDDAATTNLGNGWRIPTKGEWQELLNNTTSVWTTQNGVNGMLFTAANGSSLFLPAAGVLYESSLSYEGSDGGYWSSLLYSDDPNKAWFFNFNSSMCRMYYTNRYSGRPVRAVRYESQNMPFVIDATANPAQGGEVSGGGSYQVGAECTLTATANEGYIFTNWTENGEVVSVDATYTFTVNADRTLVANFTSNGGGDDHEYVDLGLPSGLLWATCNVGAETPEEYGDYFAWGETQPKDNYSWSTYQYCNGDGSTFIKYCNNSDYGYYGFTDNLTTLLPEDDPATVNWGIDWSTPTYDNWVELYQNTTMTWTTQNGVNGQLFTASNGNSLFLPAAGYRNNSGLYDEDSGGYYWSDSLYTGSPRVAWFFYFLGDDYFMGYYYRYYGQSVRPVRSGQNSAPTGAINGKFTINENGDQVYFSQGNLQYQASTNTWRFAENQWNYVGGSDYATHQGNVEGGDNCLISATYDGWIDLFGWGTSGWNNGNMYYQPYDIECFWDGETGRGYGPTDGTNYGYDLSGNYANADWGVYNAILNGGNLPNQWRTLTISELLYVLTSRTTSSGIRYATANVNGVNGLILLPDSWNVSIYTLNYTNNPNAPYSTNEITLSDWEILEANGAVFLPAAGWRFGTSLGNPNHDIYYWSTTSCYSYNGYNANALILPTEYPFQYISYNRWYGCSVRLVRDTE